MSDELAIIAVTSTLKLKLGAQLRDLLVGHDVTVCPPDKAREASNAGDQLNLFLYGVTFNAAFRNQDPVDRVHSGETATSPLALDLHYLLTAYGVGDDKPDARSHILLGHAMRALHDLGTLSPEDLRNGYPDSNLYRQIESVRVTQETLSVEEIYKLWSTFQTPYRVSAAYHVSVVLIDSNHRPRMPLPVLKRGRAGQGWPSTTLPPPSLSEVRLPPGRAGAMLGDTITLAGASLGGTARVAVFTHSRFGSGPSIAIGADAPATALPVTLLASAGNWSAGIYSVAVRLSGPTPPKAGLTGPTPPKAGLTRNGETETRTSNAIPLVLLPTVTAVTPPTARPGDVSLAIDVEPAILPEQQVSVLFGDQEAKVLVSTGSRLEAQIPGVARGRYVVRVRVDGVDSSPFAMVGTPPVLEFLPNQVVVVDDE